MRESFLINLLSPVKRRAPTPCDYCGKTLSSRPDHGILLVTICPTDREGSTRIQFWVSIRILNLSHGCDSQCISASKRTDHVKKLNHSIPICIGAHLSGSFWSNSCGGASFGCKESAGVRLYSKGVQYLRRAVKINGLSYLSCAARFWHEDFATGILNGINFQSIFNQFSCISLEFHTFQSFF